MIEFSGRGAYRARRKLLTIKCAHSRDQVNYTMGLRLLLLKNKTTPQDAYHEILASNNHTPEFVPLLSHGPVSISKTVEFLASDEFLHHTDSFIITSQRAVEVFHDCLRIISAESAEKAKLIRSKPGYTVGPATEQILKENGFLDVRGGSNAGNGSKLADIIMNDKPHSSSKIVFFTGVVRKDIIPVKLKSNGVHLEEEVIYKTEARDGIIENYIQCCEEKVDWVVFFSPQGTEDIVQHMKSTQPQVKIASIGPTTEEYLLDNSITAQVVAEKPTAASLYEGILRWEAQNS